MNSFLESQGIFLSSGNIIWIYTCRVPSLSLTGLSWAWAPWGTQYKVGMHRTQGARCGEYSPDWGVKRFWGFWSRLCHIPDTRPQVNNYPSGLCFLICKISWLDVIISQLPSNVDIFLSSMIVSTLSESPSPILPWNAWWTWSFKKTVTAQIKKRDKLWVLENKTRCPHPPTWDNQQLSHFQEWITEWRLPFFCAPLGGRDSKFLLRGINF